MIEIRFASQGGTAEEAAGDAYHELLNNHVNCSFPAYCSVDDVTRWANEDVTVLFFIATTGQGEWPTGARPFWQALLQQDCPQFRGLRFAIFGFGDTAFVEFNYAARRLEFRLQQCGATRFLRTGLGNEQHEFQYAQELDPWFAELLPLLEKLSEAPDANRHRRFFPKEITDSSDAFLESLESTQSSMSSDNFLAEHHVSLYIDKPTPWVLGEVCAIAPVIEKAMLDRFCECQDLDPKAVVCVESLEETHIPPQPLTLATLFTHYFDISDVPKGRWFFQVMAQYTEDDEVRKKKLEELGGSSLEGKEALFEYCKRPRRSIVEIFEDFPTTKVPLQMLVNIVPPLRAREYTKRLHRQIDLESGFSFILGPGKSIVQNKTVRKAGTYRLRLHFLQNEEALWNSAHDVFSGVIFGNDEFHGFICGLSPKQSVYRVQTYTSGAPRPGPPSHLTGTGTEMKFDLELGVVLRSPSKKADCTLSVIADDSTISMTEFQIACDTLANTGLKFQIIGTIPPPGVVNLRMAWTAGAQ